MQAATLGSHIGYHSRPSSPRPRNASYNCVGPSNTRLEQHQNIQLVLGVLLALGVLVGLCSLQLRLRSLVAQQDARHDRFQRRGLASGFISTVTTRSTTRSS